MKAQQPPWAPTAAEYTRSLLKDGQEKISWDEFEIRTTEIALFISTSFPSGTIIGLWGKNSLSYLVHLFGIIRSGCIAVPLNTRLTAQELTRLIGFLDLKSIIALEPLYPEVGQYVYAVPELQHEKFPKIPRSSVSLVPRGESASETAVILSSSGSDGNPKAVPLTLPSLMAHATAVNNHLHITAEDKWLLCLPLFHVGGLTILFRGLAAGASLIVTDKTDAETLNKFIEEERITITSMVPTMLERILELRGEEKFPDTLRAVVVGGGPISESLIQNCSVAYPTYGLTEAGSMLTCARPNFSEAERFSSGSILPGTEIKIVNDNGIEVERGQTGEIVARGPGVAKGYWKSENKTAQSFKLGWLKTADIGFVDEQGFLHVLARRTDLVLSGGENIYPREIENALLMHLGIKSAVVLPLTDEKWGQIPAALIVPGKGQKFDEPAILRYLESRLARYKLPKKIVFAEALPLLANGKVDLAAVRKLLSQ